MLSDDVNRYVAMQRGFGLKFDAPCRILLQFARYAEEHGDRYILTKRVFDWCRIASSPTQASTFFNAIRRLCVFLHAEDTRHELLPVGAFGPSQLPRPTPHLLDSDHVRAIMEAALELSPIDSIRPHTYHHLFGLLAATGLRISEALALKCSDLNEEGLVVRSGKFGKSRLLPIHPTTRLALARYLAIRDRFAADVDDLFVVTTGRSPNKSTVCRVFVQLARELGLRPPSPTRGVRLHDLRHTFAVRSLESCVHDRHVVANHMLALSTYLGHVNVTNTYWYLEATPVLLNHIAEACEHLFWGEMS
ncbi:tyrosine-type recombinase/integrase [Paraburkholderia fungorum]|uniref:tyrosine-type recombinase/integrase n=1 Tax=Paraburkholderia fungorum TaxID=134537 RepID=UPI002092F5BD|nr:tyrosine-type recombinase/integrase [Paraburkholderia fungorum]USU18470.1 tyrosine-type recombinase/integrase [Paraburkholderia fungorum]USU26467.1 tyrosine-type recombinase/integrase [Paraburkholderia fungorum]